jgi:nitrile hydratase
MARALHDMGGVERFYGPIERETDEPVFHERWEARTFGLAMAAGGILGANFDAMRDAIERLDPDVYLRNYYVRWLRACERQLEGQGFLAPGELDARLSGKDATGTKTRRAPALQKAVMTRLTRKAMAPMPKWLLHMYPRVQGFTRKARREPAFQQGDSVRAVAERPSGHTRIPGYLCGRRGRVTRAHGPMVFPDVHALGKDEDPQHLYTVAFDGREVWGPGSEQGVALYVDQIIEHYETNVGPLNGAKVVARAWVDPAYKERLLTNATKAVAELGFGGPQGEHLVAVENTPDVHNVVVCTLCSCYPWPVLGLPPNWYKSPEYRSRVVREPRRVLSEMGLELSEDAEVRVWDSSSEVRYVVLPERPAGTDSMGEQELAALVTRDSMIGVAKAGAANE